MINIVTLSGRLATIFDFKGAGVTLAIIEQDGDEYFLYWEEEVDGVKKLRNKYVIVTGSVVSVRFKYREFDDKERTAIRVRRIEGYDV